MLSYINLNIFLSVKHSNYILKKRIISFSTFSTVILFIQYGFLQCPLPFINISHGAHSASEQIAAKIFGGAPRHTQLQE